MHITEMSRKYFFMIFFDQTFIDSHYLIILIFNSIKYFSICFYDKLSFACLAILFFNISI